MKRVCAARASLVFAGVSGTPRRQGNGCAPRRIPKARNLLIPLSWYRRGSDVRRRSQLDDAAAQRDGDRLRAVAGPELLHDVLDVNLDGLFRDEEAFRDVAVTVPPEMWRSTSTSRSVRASAPGKESPCKEDCSMSTSITGSVSWQERRPCWSCRQIGRAPPQSYRGASQSIELGEELSGRLKQLSQRRGDDAVYDDAGGLQGAAVQDERTAKI